jgi:SAM-dependent methyltransferase
MTDAFHEFEQAGWQRAAAHYPGGFGTLTALAADPLLDAARVGRGTRVLDVASGPGYVAAAAARRGAIVTGIDFSTEMVALARASHPDIAFREGDAEALADPPATYDAVVASFGLLHLARPDAAIAEAHRVLAPGGRYAFTVWAPPEQTIGFRIVLGAIERHGRAVADLPEGPPFFRFADPAECRRALAAFADVEVRALPLVWRLPSPDALFAAMLDGTVRTAALLRAQTPAALAAIAADVRAEVARYPDHALAMPVVLAAATRP